MSIEPFDYHQADEQLKDTADELRTMLRAVQVDAAGTGADGEPGRAGGSRHQWDLIDALTSALNWIYTAQTACVIEHAKHQR